MMDDRDSGVETLVDQLRDSGWEVRQRAAQRLRDLGKPAAAALPALRELLRGDADYDVREAALRAIFAAETDHAGLLADVDVALRDSYPLVRAAAADLMGQLDDVKDEATSILWAAIGRELDPTVRAAMASTLQANVPDLGPEAIRRLGSDDAVEAAGGLAALSSALPTGIDMRALATAALNALRVLDDAAAIGELSFVLFRYVDPSTIEQLTLDEPDVLAWKRCRLIIWEFATGLVSDIATRRPDELTALIFATLASSDRETFEGALRILQTQELDKRLQAEERDELEQLMFRAAEQGVGLGNLALLGEPAAALQKLLDSATVTPYLVEGLLMAIPETLDEAWKGLQVQLLKVFKAGLEHSYWMVRERAAQQIRGHARDVAKHDDARAITEQLEQMAESDSDPDVQRAARDAARDLRQAERSARIPNLEEKLRTGDDSARIQVAQEILDDPSPEATRVLAREFAVLVAFGTGQVVELTGDRIRRHPDMVLPLLDQWERGLEIDDYVRHRLVEIMVPVDLQPGAQALFARTELTKPQLKGLEEWLQEEQGEDSEVRPAGDDGPLPTPKRTRAKQILEVLQPRLDEECAQRALVVRRTFARLLADMSDERFFEESEQHTFEAISAQLRRHAVRILGRRLANEEDITTRESIARTLASLGGREAVDVLTRAIVDDERTKERRQELLATYYLEPSKARSDEAAQILHGAVGAAKRTLYLLQALNVLYFVVALALVASGAFIAFSGGDTAEVLGGGIAGISGVVAIAIQVLREPLTGIQNAVTRLVQVETAFTSFIWELNLNGTYIQSQYVSEGVLRDDHIRQTVERIENAMHLSMSSVARYVEQGAIPVTPRLTGISPAYASPGSTVVLRGDALNPGSRNGRAAGTVAIDHLAINPAKLVWADDRVEFTLPGDVTNGGTGSRTVWVNVVVQGVESNSLPLVVEPARSAAAAEPAAV